MIQFTSFSVAKSFTSALVGIALTEGRIDSVDDPVTKYLPELAVVRSLLQYYPSPSAHDVLRHQIHRVSFFYQRRCSNLLLSRPARAGSGEYPHHRAFGKAFSLQRLQSPVLGLVLERTTGQNVPITCRRSSGSLGMEFDGSWSLDSQASGFELMQAGINAQAIDFAKFGRLYLNNGSWKGTQVIPASWVAESTQEDRSIDRVAYYPQDAFFQENRLLQVLLVGAAPG